MRPDTEKIFISAPVSEPASHLHQNIIGTSIPVKIADDESFQRQTTGQCQTTDCNHTQRFIFRIFKLFRRSGAVHNLDLDFLHCIEKRCCNFIPCESAFFILTLPDLVNPVQHRVFHGQFKVTGKIILQRPVCFRMNLLDNFLDILLDLDKPGNVDQHRPMLSLITPQITDCIRQIKGIDGICHAFREFAFPVLFVLEIERIAVFFFPACIRYINQLRMEFCVLRKNSCWSDVVAGCRKRHNEIFREKVMRFHFLRCFRIDENVGKRCCCKSDIIGLCEHISQFPDQLVDLGRIFFIGTCIDGSIVRLIINHQHRHINLVCPRISIQVNQPFRQLGERCGILLDDKDNSILILAKRHCYFIGVPTEITCAGGQCHCMYRLVVETHANAFSSGGIGRHINTNKSFFHSLLCLFPQGFDRAGQQNEHFVACICRFADKADIGRSLSRLYVADNQAAFQYRFSVVRLRIQNIIHQLLIQRVITQRTDHVRAEMLFVNQIILVSCPEILLNFSFSVVIPVGLLIICQNALARTCLNLIFIGNIPFDGCNFIITVRHIADE